MNKMKYTLCFPTVIIYSGILKLLWYFGR